MAAGTGLLGLTGAPTHLTYFLAAYTILIFGCGAAGILANTLVLTYVPAGEAGAAAGVSETSNQLGTAIGVAVLAAIPGAALIVIRRRASASPQAPTTSSPTSNL